MSYADTVTIEVQDSAGHSAFATFTIPVGTAGSLTVTTATLPNVNQYATSYSQTLAASGGIAPYSWTLLAQSGYNPATWQLSSAGVLTNLMPTILNVETASLTVQVTDTASNIGTATLNVTTVRQIPAGAAAIGANTLLWASKPTLSNIYFGAWGTVPNQPWSSGWPFTSPVPPQSLYSMSPSNVLQMQQLGTVSMGPDANTAIISAVQLDVSGTNTPASATLALIPYSQPCYVEYLLQSAAPNALEHISGFEFPTQHNVAGTQDIDSNNPGAGRQWPELDTWEGQGLNGKPRPGGGGYAGAAVYWQQNPPGGTSTKYVYSNPATIAQDVTQEHAWGKGLATVGWNHTFYVDNAPVGTAQTQTAAGVPLTAETQAFFSTMTGYPIVSAFNDGTTPITLLVYEVAVYIMNFLDISGDPLPPAAVGVPYSFQMITNNASPFTPYTWSDPDGVLATFGLTLSNLGLISGTPTSSGNLIAFNAICTDSQGNIAQ